MKIPLVDGTGRGCPLGTRNSRIAGMAATDGRHGADNSWSRQTDVRLRGASIDTGIGHGDPSLAIDGGWDIVSRKDLKSEIPVRQVLAFSTSP